MPAPRLVGRKRPKRTSRTRASKSTLTSSTPRPASRTASFSLYLTVGVFMDQTTTARNAAPSDWTGRVEDDALVRGQGRFGDDVKPVSALAAYFVRSPHAFAKI